MLPPLDELLESAVDRRADLGSLIEIHCGDGALGDAFGGELEFLPRWLAFQIATYSAPSREWLTL